MTWGFEMQELAAPWESNSSFSSISPRLQLAWDSTSLGALKTCPRYYQLSILEGWSPRTTSVHLTFGAHFHSALEWYDHKKFEGMSHADAQRSTLRKVLELTWNESLHRPWLSDDKYKNRETLVRSVMWYLEVFGEHDPLETVRLANGKPAVELSFRFESSYSAPSGEKYILCGHLDRVATLNGETYIVDRKTTKSAISENFFDSFNPDNQFSLYTLAGQVVYGLPIEGLIVDAAQVAITFSRFERGFSLRDQATIEEWYKDLGFWLRLAEAYAEANHYPMNEKSCGNYGGCQYRKICSKSPKVRDQWLKAEYSKRIWDPLQVRGNI